MPRSVLDDLEAIVVRDQVTQALNVWRLLSNVHSAAEEALVEQDLPRALDARLYWFEENLGVANASEET